MRTRRSDNFPTIRVEGHVLPADLIQRIADSDANLGGLTPESFHLGPNEKINEATNRSWNKLLGAWANFRGAASKLSENDPGTSVTRERWLLVLFQELGYGRLPAARAVEVGGRSYAISHWWGSVPIHLVGLNVGLDRATAGVAGAARSSPHSLVQDLLNRSEDALWGFVSNGLRLRILRDSVNFVRQAYVEFDLEAMMEGEAYSDFVMLWLLCQQSRVEGERPTDYWLERWSLAAQEQGVRALEHLREGVEEAITALGRGFLAHRANGSLRDKLQSIQLDKQDYYRQLLRLVYRLLFLFVAEDREVLLDPNSEQQARERYTKYYSMMKLRHLAERRYGTRHSDLYVGLRLVMEKLGNDAGCPELGLPALGSFLFSKGALQDLEECEIANHDLLDAVRALAFTDDRGARRQIDYKNLGSEELGSVYESLLELHPELNVDANVEAAAFSLSTTSGNERKTSGSYYTPTSLINSLLDSALEPVLDEAAKQSNSEAALLNLKVCDPACGSGHFLIAAAHRIAKRLAQVRTGDAEPSPEAVRHALRDVVGRCIYGVDINPMAVELCKVSLWMEAVEPGKPLTFLDHHIMCGNSLLGTTPALIKKGIPDEAFKPIEGDDPEYCREYKRRNRDERKGQRFLPDVEHEPWRQLGNLATSLMSIDEIADNTIEGVRQRQERYETLVNSSGYRYGGLLADAWCAAFVWKKRKSEALPYPITEEEFRRIEESPFNVPKWMEQEIKRLAGQYQFFHWHLAFPSVFYVASSSHTSENELTQLGGGFDVVLGNPPWEKINLKDEEFFAETHPHIANAANKAERKQLIEQLKFDEPHVYTYYEETKEMHDRTSNFFRLSGYFPFTGVSRINLYSVFCETDLRMLAPHGRCGLVLASGIVTDDNNKALFSMLVDEQRLISVWDFENREAIFPGIHRSYKFCLLCAGGNETHQQAADFAFYITNIAQLEEAERHFSLSSEDLYLLNPNTKTCPTFRNKCEAEITKGIYRKVPAWALHEKQRDWPGTPKTPFNMSNDSAIFVDATELFEIAEESFNLIPVYEAKFIFQFNHRFATFRENTEDGTSELTLSQLQNPNFTITSRYWLPKNILESRYPGRWFFVYRMITNATNERAAVAAIIPKTACVNSLSIVEDLTAINALMLLGCVNSFAYDYTARQKIAGTNFNHWIWHQLPIPSNIQIQSDCLWSDDVSTLEWLSPYLLELTYTAWDLEIFAQDCGYAGAPFYWDEARRFLMRCELDAAFFHLYGIARDDVDYIMETFPIVKRKDEQQYGEYRTKRIILEIYDEMAQAIAGREPYQTRLDPPPADPRVTHPAKEATEVDIGTAMN
jgi:Eco57I restriction-modification methylase